MADLDKSKDNRISYHEFSSWIRDGTGNKEMQKAKAILAPSDSDGLDVCFFNFCAAGKSGLDGTNFLKLCEDCDLLGKELTPTAANIIFCDTRVKQKGQRKIDVEHFEVALELVAEKIGKSTHEVRRAIINQGRPRKPNLVASPRSGKQYKSGDGLDVEEKSLPKSVQEAVGPVKKVEMGLMWKVFGYNTAAGRSLRVLYSLRQRPQKIWPGHERPKSPRPSSKPARVQSHKPRPHVQKQDNFLDICVQVVPKDGLNI